MITIYLSQYGDCPVKEKYRTEHQLGRSLLSGILENRFGLSFSDTALPEQIENNIYGKPYLKAYPFIHFNISHCDGLVACAAATAPVGIDIEKIHPFKDSILRKVLTPPEKTFLEAFRNTPDKYMEIFFRFWTLKESRIKHSGLGLSMPLTDFSFTLDISREPAGVTCSQKGLYFTQRRIENDYFLSICSGEENEEIQIQQFDKETL